MTDDDVKMIYDYLHENYRYENGNLIASKNNFAKKKGQAIGVYDLNLRTGYASLRSEVGKKEFKKNHQLSHLIWIYFNKEKPIRIIFLDGNITNTRIENLRSATRIGSNVNKSEKIKGYSIVRKNNKIMYRAAVELNGKKVQFGQYETCEEAQIIYNTCKDILRKEYMEGEELKKKIKELLPWCKVRILQNKHRLPGIYQRNNDGIYYARFTKNGIRKVKGFKTAIEAHEAYKNWKEEYK